MIKYKTTFLLFLAVILLSGCWDTMNIEDRGFIVGTAIDLEEMKDSKPIYSVTDQLVIPQSFGNAGSGKSSGQAFLNLTSKGTSIYKVNERLPAISSKSPYYEHLKIVLISEEVAKTEHLINQLLDRYIRDVSLRRGILVSIAKNEAKDLLEFKNPENKLPAIHMEELLKLSSEETGFPKSLTIGDIEEFHLRNRSYILPIISIKNKDIEQRESGAIFHGQRKKMIGTLAPKDMQSLALIKGEAIGSIIDFTHDDKTFTYKINRIQNKLKLRNTELPNITVDISITLYGTIKETYSEKTFTNPEEIKTLQTEISKEVKKTIEGTIEKAQKEYHADIFEVWQQLEKKNYHTWKKIQKDWESGENYFANNVTFNVEITSQIFAIGSSEKT